MAVLKVEVEVSKETYELGQGIRHFIDAVRTALADGWQTGQDLPTVITAAVGDLVPAMQGIEMLGDESKDKARFYRALSMSLVDIITSFDSGDDAAPALASTEKA